MSSEKERHVGLPDELDEIPSEDLAEKARRELDYLRSLQLHAEITTLRQANEALRRMQFNFNKRVGQVAMKGIELYEMMQQKQTERRFKLDKWTAVVIIAVIAALVFLVVFKRPPR